jgi:hypothetical protein
MLMPQGQIDRAAAAFHHPHAGAGGKRCYEADEGRLSLFALSFVASTM